MIWPGCVIDELVPHKHYYSLTQGFAGEMTEKAEDIHSLALTVCNSQPSMICLIYTHLLIAIMP